MDLRPFWRIYGKSLVIALLVLYLPQTWVFWQAIAQSAGNRGMWLAMFPTMPGGFIAAVIRVVYWNHFQAELPGPVLLLLAIAFTLVLISILTAIGARGKGYQMAAIVLGGGYSIVAALGLHAAAQM